MQDEESSASKHELVKIDGDVFYDDSFIIYGKCDSGYSTWTLERLITDNCGTVRTWNDLAAGKIVDFIIIGGATKLPLDNEILHGIWWGELQERVVKQEWIIKSVEGTKWLHYDLYLINIPQPQVIYC